MQEVHREWHDKTQGLSGPAAALIAIAIGVATNGAGYGAELLGSIGVTSPTLGVAANAAFAALASQAGISLINNQSNLGAVFKELASSSVARSVLASALTAGLLGELGLTGSTADFVADLQQQVARQAISATVDAAINGRDLDQALLGALKGAIIGTANTQLAGVVGDWTDGPNGNAIANVIAHAALGCAVAAAGSNSCGGGAIGGTVSASLGGLLQDLGLKSERIPDALRVISAAATFLAGGDAGDINNAASVAEVAELFNRQLHTEEAILLRELAEKYAEENGISIFEARRILVNQALYQIDESARAYLDPNAPDRHGDNPTARAFLAANSPIGYIPSTQVEGDPVYTDQNQEYFHAVGYQFSNKIINAGYLYEYYDLYSKLDYLDPGKANLAKFITVTFPDYASQPVLVGDLSVDQSIALVDVLVRASNEFADLADLGRYSLYNGEPGKTEGLAGVFPDRIGSYNQAVGVYRVNRAITVVVNSLTSRAFYPVGDPQRLVLTQEQKEHILRSIEGVKAGAPVFSVE